MFGFTSRPQAPAAPQPQAPAAPPDKLNFSQTLQAVLFEGLSPHQAQQRHQAQQVQQRQAEEFARAIAARMGGGMGGSQPAPMAPRSGAYDAPIGMGLDGEAFGGRAPVPMPQAQAPRPGLPNSRQFADIELQMALNPALQSQYKPFFDTVRRFDPKLTNVNGLMIDENNPENEERFIPQFDKGQEPLRDSAGRIVAVRNMDGSIQAAADMAGAVAGAQERAKAGFDVIEVPQADGTMRTVTRGQAVAGLTGQGGAPAGGAPAGGGFGMRPSTAQTKGAETLAVGQANRQLEEPVKEAARASQLSALDEMEALLPDVVAGFGADARIQLDRAKAAAGDKDAQRRVAATQTYLNQGRVLVAQIIKTFGSNPTEGERKFTEQMSGADASLDPKTLQVGIELARERLARESGRPLPLPKDTSRLKPGTVYQTKRGPLLWNGREFEAR